MTAPEKKKIRAGAEREVGMNNVVLMGRLTRDPELRKAGETSVTNFTLAVDRDRKNKDGERETDFIRVTVFGKQAETVCKWLAKGKRTMVQGRIQTGSYTDKDGNNRYTTDVIANRVQFIDFAAQDDAPAATAPSKEDGFAEIAEDVPF